MKKFIIVLTVVAMTALPFRNVHASLESVAIQRFVVLSTVAACAINIQVLSIINNQLNGNEALLLNGNVFAFLTAAILLSGLAQGDFVLFASPAFEAEAGITADVPITDQQCADLQATDTFTFRGSQGNIVSQFGLLLTGLALLTAIVFNFDTDSYGIFDLTLFFLTITTLLTFVLVGNTNGQDAEGGGGGGDMGGCNLNQASPEKNFSPWALLGLGWLLSGAFIRLRRRAC